MKGLSAIVLVTLCVTQRVTSLPLNPEDPGGEKTRSNQAHEVVRDRYIPVSRASMPTSPPYRYSSYGFTTVQVNVDSLGMNIVGDAANEPSIAADPVNPDRLAIGWRQFDTILSDFRQAGYGYSTDRGQSWTFPGVLDPGVFRSDPVLGANSNGEFFYYSLTIDGNYFCTLYKDSSGGSSWDGGVYAYGGDKAWMTVDRTAGVGRDQMYFAWDYAGCCGSDWFTRSTNEGGSFDPPVPVPDEPIWGVTTVGPDGAVYVAGRRSTTNQEFVVAKASAIQDSTAPLTFDFTSAVDLGGAHQFNIGIGPNPGGLQGQVWIAADHSAGPTAGYIYVLCSVDPPGADPLDVHFVRSKDGGLTWSSPLRLNDDPGTSAWQWFGTMSVSPDGRIDVVWLDTRGGAGFSSALYYTYSVDGGLSWSANEQLSDSFNPHLGWPNQNKLGDYFDMVSEIEGAHLAWAGTFNGEQDVYYGWIDSRVTDVAGDDSPVPNQFGLAQNYPNPFNGTSRIQYHLPFGTRTSLRIYDMLGREIATLVDAWMEPGVHTAVWDAGKLAGGVYVYRLDAGSYSQSRKLVLLK